MALEAGGWAPGCRLTKGGGGASERDLPWAGVRRGAHWAPGPQVEASAPPGQDRWLRDYCASGLYILTLLVEGYGFSEETWGGIEFRQQVTAGGLGGWGRVGLQGRSPAALT